MPCLQKHGICVILPTEYGTGAWDLKEKERLSQWLYIAAILLAQLLPFAGFAALAWRCARLERPAGVAVFAALAFAELIVGGLTLRQKGRQGRWLGLFSDLLLSAFLLPMCMGIFLYEENFFHHQETSGAATKFVSSYPGLREEPSPFVSDMDQTLDGSFYSKDVPQHAPVVILAHGNGVGRRAYIDVINALASEGYLVYAYDATGYDASEGKSTWGLPQGSIDLAYAIDHVTRCEPGRPLVLLGHSWGGYAVGSVLNTNPHVRAVISLAGFDNSLDLLEEQGRQLLGPFIRAFIPYLSLYEWIKFGKNADYTASGGFANSDAAVLIVHSADDSLVPPRLGYDKYLERFQDDPRFTFHLYQDRGHERVFNVNEVKAFLESAVG